MDTDILSVGIDIGTTTTQVIFSKLKMKNTSSFFAVPHVNIVDKEVTYKSDIYITPLLNESLIDGDKVKAIVASEFQKSGYQYKDTSTGAVIITGESARKENAALVLEKLSDFAGDFVVSTAGPDLESVIAGKGSGAQSYSEENECTAVNLDIGGGTTNIVVFDCGDVIAKGCVDIGGRQIRLTDDYSVEYISESAKCIAENIGINISVGKIAEHEEIKKICEAMVHLLEQMLGIYDKTDLLNKVKTNGSTDFTLSKPIKAICFSGGVADCVYNTNHDPLQYGDIGVYLGKAVREGRLFTDFSLIQAKETIRATVVGAGTYTTSISGSTISYNEAVLPLKNVPVLKLDTEEENSLLENTDRLKKKISWFLEQSDTNNFVLAFKGTKNPTYIQIKSIAKCIYNVLDEILDKQAPIIIIVEQDIAKALGQAMTRINESNRMIVSVDSIKVEANDFIDMGKPLMNGMVIPVVVKTLVFG